MKPDELRKRIRAYEDVTRTSVPRRVPVLMRFDGRAFHTLTQGLEKPFDDDFKAAMDATAIALCQEMSNARLAYVESDEITVLMIPYKRFTTEPWFSNEVQKMCSVGAAIATGAFNRNLLCEKPATFDARVFTVPREEVCNVFIDRQRDCIRNSILSCGQVFIGKKAIHGMDCTEIHDQLVNIGKPWQLLDNWKKFGRIVERVTYDVEVEVPAFGNRPITKSIAIRSKWEASPAPVFSNNRNVVDRFVWPEDEEGAYSRPQSPSEEEHIGDIIASLDPHVP